MYTGIKLENVNVDSYATALKALEQRAKRSRVKQAEVLQPGGVSAPLGHRRSGVTSIRMLRDESIACRLYSTDVVTWHKDNSVTIDSYPTVTTAAFARCLLPAGLRLGADMMMSFDAKIIHVENERWGNYSYTSHQRTCCADGTYRQHGDTWLPDEDTIQPISVVTLDTKLTRAAAKEHNLAGFTTWLFTMGHHEVEIEHAGTDYEACVEALKAREFRKAASHLPPFSGSLASFGLRYRIKPLPFRNVRWGEPITMGSIDYVRRYIYEQAGAYTTSKVPHMSLSGYEKQKALRRKLNAVGIYP